MFVQTEVTPNPNSLKFLPGKKVSNNGPHEITKKDGIQNDLVRNILSVNGVEGIFLGEDFISVNKADTITWDDIKHIVISLINDFYSDGKEFVIDENVEEQKVDFDEIEQKIIKILDQKIRPAVARDGGDIKFKEFKDGVVKVQLQGSCSGCPSSTMTLKQGVQNLLSINGVEGIFLGEDFISVNKNDTIDWEDIKHIVISLINDFYSNGKQFVIDESLEEEHSNLDEIEKKIVKILDQKIRPAVAKDGGDIKFKEFKDGIVKVQLQGSCSGCPSSTMTLKQGVQNLLCHYLPEVKEVVAI